MCTYCEKRSSHLAMWVSKYTAKHKSAYPYFYEVKFPKTFRKQGISFHTPVTVGGQTVTRSRTKAQSTSET